MSTPFSVKSFEEYLNTVRDELPKGRKYFHDQTRLFAAGYPLKPSIGRYEHVLSKSFRERDELEREVLEVFSNHLVTHVQHLPRSEWEALAIAQHHGLATHFMDWTENPLVALYFVVRETKTDDKGEPTNSAVYVLTSDPTRYTDFSRSQPPGVKPVGDLATRPVHEQSGYAEFGLDSLDDDDDEAVDGIVTGDDGESSANAVDETSKAPSSFQITENVIYHPPHISPRMRAQDSVLLACHQPLEALENRDWLEIMIRHDTHDLHSAHLDRAFSAFIVRLDWGSRSASIRVARDAEQIEHLSLQHG